MPVLLITCDRGAPVQRRALFPEWRVGEWWEVVSTVAVKRPAWGADLSGLDLFHRFTVEREEVVDGVRCWVVEVRPFRLREQLEATYGDFVAARLWVAQKPFRPIRAETAVGTGRNLVEPPQRSSTVNAAGRGPILLESSLPTVLDLPIGPHSADEQMSEPWQAGDFRDAITGRVVRQTVHEVVEKRGHWRERVLKVSLSDGAVACHQVWIPGEPWPETFRTWSGVSPEAPFVYQTKLRAWSQAPYRAWIGTAFLVFGFAAQALFTMRFVVQWIASERVGRSVIPMAFWYFSLFGGLMLLAYAVYRLDPVFILGQSFGVVIYFRNVWLRIGEKRRAAGPVAGEPAGSGG